MVMISVLESALTVSPTLMATETTVPLIGLVSVASVSDCSALVRSACAVSMAAWSDAICSGVSVLAAGRPGAAARRSRRADPSRSCRRRWPCSRRDRPGWAEEPELPVEVDSRPDGLGRQRLRQRLLVLGHGRSGPSRPAARRRRPSASAASQVAWPVVVLVLALVQSSLGLRQVSRLLVAGRRRQGRLVLGQGVLVLGDRGALAAARAPRAGVPDPRCRRPVRGRRRGRARGPWTCPDDESDDPLDWFSSSSASLASSALSVDSAEETDSLSAVVSSVPSV